MAIVSRVNGALFLELGGQVASPLRNAQPASLRVDKATQRTGRETVLRRTAQVALGEMAAEFDLAAPGPLVDWLGAALAGDLAQRDGAVLGADANGNTRRRIGFRGARLSSLTWPLLDATDGKRAVSLALRWLVDSVEDGPGAGQGKATTIRSKSLLAANFRVTGLPFGDDAVSAVQLPALQVAWTEDRVGGLQRVPQLARHQLGELAVTVTTRRADAARAWVHKLVADGRIDESDGLALQVDLLDASMKKARASVQLTGCLLCGMDEEPLGGNADRIATLTLRFDVGGIKLTLA
jgi:hypothetical protein